MCDNDNNLYQIFSEKDDKVFMANQLARAEWKTSSVWTERILSAVLSQIGEADIDFKKQYTVKFSDFSVTDGGKDYKTVEKITTNLTKETITVYDDTTKVSGTIYPLFLRTSFHNINKEVKIKLNPELAPFFLQLKERFTVYHKLDFIKIPTTYGQRLFKLLKSWESEPQTQISIEDLHRLLGSPKSCKNNYAEFDRRILAPVREHILENTDLTYTYKPFRSGRKIVAVVFLFGQRKKIRKAPQKKE